MSGSSGMAGVKSLMVSLRLSAVRGEKSESRSYRAPVKSSLWKVEARRAMDRSSSVIG